MSSPRVANIVRRRFLVACAAACVVLGGIAPPVRAEQPATRPVATSQAAGEDIATVHYDLHVEHLDAQETGRMLEQLYLHLTHFFGKAPSVRLSLCVMSTQPRWAAALRRDHLSAPDAGGFYSADTHKAYLYIQPSDYFTRQLILHEAVHQFHRLAIAGSDRALPAWYVEGLAEYFGMHNWDGNSLKTGVVPAATLEDYPAKALKQLDKVKGDLEAVISGRSNCDRPLAWALVHFLMGRDPKKFRELSARLDRGEAPLEAWQGVYGKEGIRVADGLRQWIERNWQPWQIVWISWQQRGDCLEGKSTVVGLAVLKRTPARLTVELEPVGRPFLAGLVVGFQDPNNFHLIQLGSPTELITVQRKDRKWVNRLVRTVPAPTGRPVLSVECTSESVTPIVNGRRLEAMPVQGKVGLSIDNCRALFHIIDLDEGTTPTSQPATGPATKPDRDAGTQ
jgi:hypothetical protein